MTERKQKLRKAEGITLVALVVTIIVLLILAGVSISMVIGNNGVLNQSEKAVEQTNYGKIKEEVSMALASIETLYYSEGIGSTKEQYYTEKNLARYLQGEVIFIGEDESEDILLSEENLYEVEYKGVVYEVGLEKILSGEKFSGYKVAEDVIEKGQAGERKVSSIVLSEERVKIYIDEEKEIIAVVKPSYATNKEVEWEISDNSIAEITINERTMTVKGKVYGIAEITCKAKDGSGVETKCEITIEEKGWSEEYVETKQYTDSKGKTATIPKGFQVSLKEEEDDIEEGLVVRNASDRNEFVWIPVEEPESMYIKDGVSSGNHAGKLYASNTGNNFDSSYSAFSYTKGSGIREPDTLSGSGYDRTSANLLKMQLFKVGSGTDNLFVEADLMLELQTEYNNIVTSVETYKGFYVGRYETSLSGTIAQSKRGVMPMTAESTSGNTWYGMYGKQKRLYNDASSSVQSGMIWGSQYDQVMLRIMQYEPSKDVKNSTDWGNYGSTTFEYIDVDGSTKTKSTNMVIPTGSTERNEAYNIYDLAGNLYEWTTEANTTDRRIGRGGSYGSSGNSIPSSYRYTSNPAGTSTGVSSRIQLYIK